jgi:hypothetical protein
VDCEVEGLLLPQELCRLVEAGHWPRSQVESNRQQLADPPIPRELVERLAPGEPSIYLYPPPFRTIASTAHDERDFWETFGALHELHPRRSILIGDFGLVSLLKTPSTAQSLTFPHSGSRQATPMRHLLYALLATARPSLKPQRELALQTLASRQQLAIVLRTISHRATHPSIAG